jgi:hypothetical protein
VLLDSKGIVTAASVVVCRSGRAAPFAGACAGVKHALAFVAPSPATLLLRTCVFPEQDRIMTAASVVVCRSGRAVPFTGACAGVKHTLTLVTPSPAALLLVGLIFAENGDIVAAASVNVCRPSRTVPHSGARFGVEHPFAFATPSPSCLGGSRSAGLLPSGGRGSGSRRTCWGSGLLREGVTNDTWARCRKKSRQG